MKVNIFENLYPSAEIQPLFGTGGDLSGRFSNNGINSEPASSPVICFSSCSTQSGLAGDILTLRARFVTLQIPLCSLRMIGLEGTFKQLKLCKMMAEKTQAPTSYFLKVLSLKILFLLQVLCARRRVLFWSAKYKMMSSLTVPSELESYRVYVNNLSRYITMNHLFDVAFRRALVGNTQKVN